MKVSELCNREVVMANKAASVLELANLMRKHHVGDIIITQQENDLVKPIGIVTDRDIVIEVIAKEAPIDSCTAFDIMSYELTTVKESASVWDALELMREKGIRRLPVVSAQGALTGVICVDDLHAFYTEQMQSMVSLTQREQRREMRLRR